MAHIVTVDGQQLHICAHTQRMHGSHDVRCAAQALTLDGRYSKYTVMIMTYESRTRLAQLAVRHYSRCPSVGEVVIVWNAGEARSPCGCLPSVRWFFYVRDMLYHD